MTGPTFRALCNDQFINVRGGAGVGKKLATCCSATLGPGRAERKGTRMLLRLNSTSAMRLLEILAEVQNFGERFRTPSQKRRILLLFYWVLMSMTETVPSK
jgi:hypothetical protein